MSRMKERPMQCYMFPQKLIAILDEKKNNLSEVMYSVSQSYKAIL